MPNERICIQSSVWDCIIYLAYLVGMLIYRRFPHPFDNALTFCQLFYHYFSQGDWYFLPRLLSRWGLSEQLDGPFDGGSREFRFYKSFHLMKHHARSILFGSLLAVIVNTSFTALVAKIFGMDFFLAISLFPKSVTTAMAVGITEKLQGLTTVTLVVVVATGILTSVIGPTPLKWLKIDDPVAVGLSLGGTGHAVGTGTALRYGSVAGAMGGLAIGVTGILYVFVSPIVASLILS